MLVISVSQHTSEILTLENTDFEHIKHLKNPGTLLLNEPCIYMDILNDRLIVYIYQCDYS